VSSVVSGRGRLRDEDGATSGKAPRPRLAVLDGLRILAALSVAVHHYTTYWALDGVHKPWYFLSRQVTDVTIYGFLGVELFFMISGFAICMSSWGRGVRDFFASRVSRLYPAYWFCVLLTFAITSIFYIGGHIPQRVSLEWSDVLVNLTMLQEPLGIPAVDNVYWTLWAEIRFYLLFAAAVVLWGVTYRRTVAFLVAWLVAAVSAAALEVPFLETITISDFAAYFIAGAAMYLIHRCGPNLTLWLLIAGTWTVNMFGLQVRLGPEGFGIPVWPAMVIVSLSYVVLLLVALGKTDRINWTWLTLAGALTYPYYLLHQRIGYTVIRKGYELTDLPVAVLVFGTVVLMLVPAWLVYRLVERPLGPRLRRALQQR
jgi:peptidoglycan/LPS O-acetylase OafA/YrhL